MTARDYVISNAHLGRDYILNEENDYSTTQDNRDYILNENTNYFTAQNKSELEDIHPIQQEIQHVKENKQHEKPILMDSDTDHTRVVIVTEAGVHFSGRYSTKTSPFASEPQQLEYIKHVISPHILPYHGKGMKPNAPTFAMYTLSGGYLHDVPTDQTALISVDTKHISSLAPLPFPLVGHSIVCLPTLSRKGDVNHFLLLGGLNQHNQVHGGNVGPNTVSSDLWHHDGVEWEYFGNTGPQLYQHHSFIVGYELGKFCVYGGFTTDNKPNKTIFVFDILSQTWGNYMGSVDSSNSAQTLAVAWSGHTMRVLESGSDNWRVWRQKLHFIHIKEIPSQMFEFGANAVTVVGQSQAIFSTVREGHYGGGHVILKAFKEDSQQAKWSEFLDDLTRELGGSLLVGRWIDGISVAIGICRKPLMLMFKYKQPLTKYIEMHPLSIEEVVTYAWQLALLVETFADMKLVHGDVKLENCLIDENKKLWLCDLGLVQNCFAKKERFFGLHGAPELWAHYKTGFDLRKADIYAFGFTVWQLLTNGTAKYPFTSKTVRLESQNGVRPNIPECPVHLRELIQSCWQHDPESRPSFGIIRTLRAIGKEFGISEQRLPAKDMPVRSLQHEEAVRARILQNAREPIEVLHEEKKVQDKRQALEDALLEQQSTSRNVTNTAEMWEKAKHNLKLAEDYLYLQENMCNLQLDSAGARSNTAAELTQLKNNPPLALLTARTSHGDALRKVEKIGQALEISRVSLAQKKETTEKAFSDLEAFLAQLKTQHTSANNVILVVERRLAEVQQLLSEL